ncbi:MAG: hypoxanthine phosphoribosyltransferase [Proteobacteria bacterium]|nr:hypoxanthine phosphoribosyltransferase [Pseudomonadota bacterium]
MKIRKVLYSKEEIDKRVRELADIISRDYQGGELIVIGVLKGAFVFVADLIRCLSIPCVVDFVRVASYGSATVSSEKIEFKKDVEMDIKGKDVLIVEDIVDTGLTISFLAEKFKERSPNSLKVCAFLDKKHRRKIAFDADYVGFTVGEEFVVGYGIDFNEMDRFLPDVCVIEE